MGITNKDVLKTVLKVPQLEEQMDSNIQQTTQNANNINSLNSTKADKVDLTNLSNTVNNVVEDTTNKFSGVENKKADKIALDVERKRIDSFTSLQQGSTTGDAELIDGRIDITGYEYGNIGGSMRGQFSQVFEMFEKPNIKFFDALYENGFIDKTGAKKTHALYNYTTPIKLLKGETLFVYTRGENGNVSIISSTINSIIKPLVIDDSTNEVKLYNYTATIDIDIIISVRSDVKHYSYISYDEIPLINEKINLINEGFIKTESKQVDKMNREAYVRTNGTIAQIVGGKFAYTSPIRVLKGEKINFYGRGYLQNISVISKCDSKGGGITPITISIDSEYRNYVYVATEDTFIILSGACATNEDIFSYEKSAQILTSNSSKEITLMNKILFSSCICIGDSITEGYRKSGYIDKIKNYPSFISKLTNWSVVNAGKSGITTQGWWTDKCKTYTYEDKDIVLIKLGQNGGLTDTIDSDTNNSGYENYADTNTGCYCKIIEYIKERNPNIKIMLIPIKNYDASGKNVNAVIKKIASKYNLAYLDIHDNGYCNLDDVQYHISSTGSSYDVHFNTVGYLKLAKVILIKLSEHIEINSNEFYDF